jgi:hypothetical protein
VTGGKRIAVWSQSISGVSAIISLVAFYDIHGGKRGAILLFFPGHHTRHIFTLAISIFYIIRCGLRLVWLHVVVPFTLRSSKACTPAVGTWIGLWREIWVYQLLETHINILSHKWKICLRMTVQNAKYEFATLNTCSNASIVVMDILWKKRYRSSARDASFHTKHASNTNDFRVVLLEANSNLALSWLLNT